MKRYFRVCKQVNRVSLAVLLSVLSSASFAEVGANITLASQYIWRGVDLNNTNPAIQGGFDWNLQNGIYSGVWASNVSVAGSETTNNIEMDFYVGYTKLIDDFGLDFSFIRYEFPKSESDFEELKLQGSYKGLSLAYYQNIKNSDVREPENYVRLKAEINLPGAVGFTLAAGRESFDNQDEVNNAFIGFTKFLGGVNLALSGTTSNLDKVTETNIDTEFVTVSVSKSF